MLPASPNIAVDAQKCFLRSFVLVLYRLFGLWSGDISQGIVADGGFHLGAGHMGVNFCSAQVLVPQDLFKDPDIHSAVLIHQGSGGMTELVGRVAPAAQSRRLQALLHDLFHPPGGEGPLVLGKEEVLPVLFHLRLRPDGHVHLQSTDAGVVEVDHPLLIAFAQQHQGVILPVDAAFFDAHQLGKAHPAVEQQGDDAVVPLLPGAWPIHRLEKLEAFLQGQVFGQGLPLAGGLQVLDGTDLQKARLAAEVIIKGAQAGDLPGPGGGVVLIGGLDKIQKTVGIGKGDSQDGLLGKTFDGNIRKVWLRHGQMFAGGPEIPQEEPQINVVGVHRPLGAALDGEHIKEEIL